MGDFLGAIQHVTGPLTLIAFLAVVFLAVFRRSVKDEKGLEYLYQLMSAKLTRKDFYSLAMRALNLGFAACILIFALGVGGFVLIKLNEGGAPASQPVVSGNTVSGDQVVAGSGSVVATGGSQISLGGAPTQGRAPSQPPGGGGYAQIIQRESGNIIMSGDGNERIRVPNQGERVDGEKRLSETYRIDILPGHRSTQALRDQYGLQPIASMVEMENSEDGEFFITPEMKAVYAFTVPWVIGEANFARYPFIPMSGGSAILEVHKRPSGVFSVVGFVTQAEADALAGLIKSEQMVDIGLMTSAVADSRAAVSIPLARIDSIQFGGVGVMDFDMGVDKIDLRVW